MRRTHTVVLTALLVILSACGGGQSSTGEVITADGTPSDAASSEAGQSATAAGEPPSAGSARRGAGKQHVSLGGFGERAPAVAVAEFYEQLWMSYQEGKVTDGLARLTTGSALRIFRDRVRDYRQTGHTVADLAEARIVEVDGTTVFVCMASSSYQRLEARTGAAVNPPSSGHTQYVVQMRGPAPWKVDTINGTENSQCGKVSP